MSDPTRPAGDPGSDPTASYKPPSYTMPGETPGAAPESPSEPQQAGSGGGYTMPSGGDYGAAPTSGSGGYPPPTSGAAGYPPPTSGAAGYPPPTSGAGGYGPTSGAAYPGYPTPDAPPGYAGTPGGGYTTPPGGGYPAIGGYGQPPAGYANNDEKTYALIAHWGGVAGWFLGVGLFGWVGPLIAYLGKGNESPTVRAHAVTSLNFHITWTGAYLVSVIVAVCTFGFGAPLVFIAWLVPVIIGIIGGVKATNGEYYRYPAAVNLIK